MCFYSFRNKSRATPKVSSGNEVLKSEKIGVRNDETFPFHLPGFPFLITDPLSTTTNRAPFDSLPHRYTNDPISYHALNTFIATEANTKPPLRFAQPSSTTTTTTTTITTTTTASTTTTTETTSTNPSTVISPIFKK